MLRIRDCFILTRAARLMTAAYCPPHENLQRIDGHCLVHIQIGLECPFLP